MPLQFAHSIKPGYTNSGMRFCFLLFSRTLLLQGATPLVTLWYRASVCPVASPPKRFSHFHFLCISACFMPSWVLKKISPQIFFLPKNFLQWAVAEASKASHNATKHSSLIYLWPTDYNVNEFLKMYEGHHDWLCHASSEETKPSKKKVSNQLNFE